MFVVYLTCYRGNLLPPFYIGSTSIKRIEEGYHGSVASKLYKKIWNKELREHPERFNTRIVSTHKTREEAFAKEQKLQETLRVVKSSLYVNKALANGKGKFGAGRKGRRGKLWNNGAITKMFYADPGPGWVKGRIWSEEHRENARIAAVNSRGSTKSSDKPRGRHSREFYRTISTLPRILKVKTCPHCGTVGSGGNMSRYHFGKCVKLRI